MNSCVQQDNFATKELKELIPSGPEIYERRWHPGQLAGQWSWTPGRCQSSLGCKEQWLIPLSGPGSLYPPVFPLLLRSFLWGTRKHEISERTRNQIMTGDNLNYLGMDGSMAIALWQGACNTSKGCHFSPSLSSLRLTVCSGGVPLFLLRADEHRKGRVGNVEALMGKTGLQSSGRTIRPLREPSDTTDWHKMSVRGNGARWADVWNSPSVEFGRGSRIPGTRQPCLSRQGGRTRPRSRTSPPEEWRIRSWGR